MLGEELSEQGYHASYVYCDAQMMEITKAQMELLEGRVPEKANEVVVSEYFLSTYGNNAKIGDTVTLDTESFHGDYVVTGIMDSVNEKEANTCAIILSNADVYKRQLCKLIKPQHPDTIVIFLTANDQESDQRCV